MHAALPSGETLLFPVIGDPVAQVRSPGVMTALFAERGCDAIVVPLHVAASDVAGVFQAAERIMNVGGLLVTVPHKAAALALCSDATERARFVGSANVVRRNDGGWQGDNTDGAGFLDGLERQGFRIEGRSALLAGCGGAGAAIAFEMLERGIARLAIHDTDFARRDAVIDRLAARHPGRVAAGSEDPTGYDLVANATPMGMRPGDPMPIDAGKLAATQFVACVITRPDVPPLIETARRLGCRTMVGSAMFDAQAETLAAFLLAPAEPRSLSGRDGTTV